jgi:hypothetical protein
VPQQSPKIAFQWLEREKLAVVYQGSQPAPQAEWQAHLDFLRRIADVEHRVLLYGGRQPSSSQLDEIKQATRGKAKPKVALLSPSTALRFVASMFTLLNRNYRFFAPSEFQAALAHLGCTPEETPLVTRTYEELRDRVEAGSGVHPTPHTC